MKDCCKFTGPAAFCICPNTYGNSFHHQKRKLHTTTDFYPNFGSVSLTGHSNYILQGSKLYVLGCHLRGEGGRRGVLDGGDTYILMGK